ncbi:MAG TPA: hypothetical protein VFH51_07765 [Myxococcota bacterium]|nr:hypothetical protein [Myxococcota bacterium]
MHTWLLWTLLLNPNTPALRCDDLDLAGAAQALRERAASLYPESHDRVVAWLDAARAAQEAGNLKEGCGLLGRARDFLAREEGPRVLSRDKPDLAVDAAPCADVQKLEVTVRATLRKRDAQLYPRARKQVGVLMESVGRASPTGRCALLREVRDYLVLLFPELASKLKE